MLMSIRSLLKNFIFLQQKNVFKSNIEIFMTKVTLKMLFYKNIYFKKISIFEKSASRQILVNVKIKCVLWQTNMMTMQSVFYMMR
jgi:hypothetical protein